MDQKNKDNSGRLYLGTSGWSYKSWEGVFYPEGASSRDYLRHYVSRFPSIEIDSTFYAIPRAATVQNWCHIAPPGFLFVPKFPRAITHEKNLQQAQAETAQFLHTMRLLDHHLGPLILQFEYKFSPQFFPALANFLQDLPGDLRFAVEVRNRKWLTDAFYDLLTNHRVALVQSDLYYMPRITRVTADFVIIRLLGDRRKVPDDDFSHRRLDRGAQLDFWADRIVDYLQQGLTVFTFSNNRFEGHAPETLARLQERLAQRGIDLRRDET